MAAYGSFSACATDSTMAGGSRFRGGDRIEAPAEPGNGGIGIVPVAIHELVDRRLQALAHRLEANPDDTGRDQWRATDRAPG